MKQTCRRHFIGMALAVVATLGLASNAMHLDITSFHVDSEYAVDEEEWQRN